MDDEELAAVAADELRRRVLVALEFLGDAYYVRPAHRAVIELVRRAEEAATLRTERDRLARILAVERGDESQAPEGWCLQMDWPDWFHPDSGADVERNERVWRFSVGAAPMQGDFMSALEAMEAADKARGVRHE